jgi:hypothetical protein
MKNTQSDQTEMKRNIEGKRLAVRKIERKLNLGGA